MRNDSPFLRGFLVFALLGGAAAPLALATPGYTGPDPCKLAVQGDSPVAKACRDGGQKAAKGVMKKMVAAAGKKGQKFTCDQCHKGDDNTQLTGDAKKLFEKLLALQ
jgi:hypothetical protein